MTIYKSYNKIRIFLFFLITLLIVFSLFIISNKSIVKGKTIIVGNSSQANYTSIIDAIDNANNFDTIIVETNTYDEHLIIDKSINIIANPGVVISTDNIIAFYLKSNNTTIEGFEFKNNNVAIFIESGFNNKIIDNSFESNANAVFLSNASFNMISDNSFFSNSEGIRLFQSSLNVIENNYFKDQISNSISIWEKSNNNRIVNNTLRSKDDTSFDSIRLERWCNNNFIENNYLEEANIRLHKCFNNMISNNTIKDVNEGIYFSYSSNNTIRDNSFISCKVCGVYLYRSENNFIIDNNCDDTPEIVKESYQTPIVTPGFEIFLFFIILFMFVSNKKRFFI